MTDHVGTNLAYVGYIVFQAEPGKGIEFLAVKLDGAAGKIAGTAGMQVNADPLSQIVSLVDFQVGRFGEKGVCFHSVGARISEWKWGWGVGVGNFSLLLQAEFSLKDPILSLRDYSRNEYHFKSRRIAFRLFTFPPGNECAIFNII